MSERPRVYVAGPMTGIPDQNRPAFRFAWNHLTQRGFHVISPHFLESSIEVDTRAAIGTGEVYRYALPIDIFALSSCSYVVALPGWETSNGAGFERHGAELMRIPWIAPEYTSDEYPGGLDDWLDECIDMIQEMETNGKNASHR